MARGVACPGCGGRVRRRAAICPACGHVQGVPALVFEMPGDDEDEPLSPPLPGRSRPARGLLFAAVVASGLVASAMAIGASQGDKTERAAPTATTSSSTTAFTTWTTVAPTTPPSTLSIQLGDGPVLGQPVGAVLVALVHEPGITELVRLDLDTGTVIRRPLSLFRSSARLLATRRTTLIIDTTNATLLLANGETRAIDTGAVDPPVVNAGPNLDTAWVWQPDQADPLVLLDLLTGAQIARYPLPGGAMPVGTDPDRHLLLQSRTGAIYRFDPMSGTADLLSAGRVFAAGRQRVVEDVCDDHLACSIQSRDLRTGRTTPLPQADLGPTLTDWSSDSASLSPDERFLVAGPFAMQPSPARWVVVDLSSGATVGTVAGADQPGSPLWTPDGQWVLQRTPGGLTALAVADPSHRTVALPFDRLVGFTLVPKH